MKFFVAIFVIFVIQEVSYAEEIVEAIILAKTDQTGATELHLNLVPVPGRWGVYKTPNDELVRVIEAAAGDSNDDVIRERTVDGIIPGYFDLDGHWVRSRGVSDEIIPGYFDYDGKWIRGRRGVNSGGGQFPIRVFRGLGNRDGQLPAEHYLDQVRGKRYFDGSTPEYFGSDGELITNWAVNNGRQIPGDFDGKWLGRAGNSGDGQLPGYFNLDGNWVRSSRGVSDGSLPGYFSYDGKWIRGKRGKSLVDWTGDLNEKWLAMSMAGGGSLPANYWGPYDDNERSNNNNRGDGYKVG